MSFKTELLDTTLSRISGDSWQWRMKWRTTSGSTVDMSAYTFVFALKQTADAETHAIAPMSAGTPGSETVDGVTTYFVDFLIPAENTEGLATGKYVAGVRRTSGTVTRETQFKVFVGASVTAEPTP